MKINVFLYFLLIHCIALTSCLNNKGTYSDESKLDIDTISEGIGVVRFSMIDTLKLYKAPNDSDYIGFIFRDPVKPQLNFSPKKLKLKFDPLYFDFWRSQNNHVIGSISDLSFRLIDYNDNWAKILYNEKESLVCYIKNEKLFTDNRIENDLFYYIIFSWSDYFKPKDKPIHNTTGDIIGNSGNHIPILVDRDLDIKFFDKIGGNIIPTNQVVETSGFGCDSIEGNWMKIKSYPEDKAYWIKWKEGRKILINYRETWGLE